MVSIKSRLAISLFVFGFLACLVLANGNDAPAGKKVLAVLDDLSIKHTHSIFFKSLEDNGYKVTYTAADVKVTFKKYGEWLYDHLILFSPKADDLAGIDPQTVIEYIDAGHSVIVAADSELSDPIRTIASECNIEFDSTGTYVIDHHHFDKTDFDGPHTLLVADQLIHSPVVLGKTVAEAPILFRGIGQDIQEDSPLLFSILSGSPTAYSSEVDEPVKDLHVAGKKTSLVTALQARNNARVLFSGSLELFSNRFFVSPVQVYGSDKSYERSGNEHFAKQVAQWTFKERGILRAVNVTHHIVGQTQPSDTYTIKDEIEYHVTIEEWNGRRWVPYIANDVQLEYIMLDPYVRTFLKPDEKGDYSVRFTLPDVYGVFTFKVEYVRRGYGFLNVIHRVPVRPFRHTQYERFIPSAFPYYASAFSMLVGLFLFSWVFLYSADHSAVAIHKSRRD